MHAAVLLLALAPSGGLAHSALRAPADAAPPSALAPEATSQPPTASKAERLVQPATLDQHLLVCNAYPSSSPLVLTMGGASLDDDVRPIAFQECRSFGSRQVHQGDKLDLSLRENDMRSTFEVGVLPQNDAQLLLVPYKRKGSSMIHFQSYAFGKRADGKDAQLALLDAFVGNSSTQLRMKDNLYDPESTNTPLPKHIEELSFDRVYSVEAGVYEAEMDERTAPKFFNFQKDTNYVVVRAGEDEGDFSESLIVFPETPLPPKAKKVVAPKPTAAPAGGGGILAWLFSRR